jgi:hypothetical protein
MVEIKNKRNYRKSQLIDGANSYSLTSKWAFITVVANGGTWMIVAKN